MLWLCAYTSLRPETEAALVGWVPDGDDLGLVDVLGDDYAYGRLLCECWATGLDFAVVEQDIVIREDVAYAFSTCPQPYCAYPYSWSTTVGVALGCTRFRGVFTQRYPDAMREACETPSAYGQPGHWKQLDVFLQRRILRDQHGEQPCGHLPPVEHVNPGRALVDGADPTPLLMVEGWA